MALTLSVGFVVDDAIVMLENIVRHMEMGKPRRAGGLRRGRAEIGFTILSMTLSLAAVFIPVLFMSGIMGRLFHEFAVTISVAILISGFVSLSLTPMLCSRFLKPPARTTAPSIAPRRAFFDGMRDRLCVDAARRAAPPVSHPVRGRGRTLAATVYLFGTGAQRFHPQPGHRADLNGTTEAPQDISYEAMVEQQASGRRPERRSERGGSLFERGRRLWRGRRQPGPSVYPPEGPLRPEGHPRADHRETAAQARRHSGTPDLFAEPAAGAHRWIRQPQPLPVHAAGPQYGRIVPRVGRLREAHADGARPRRREQRFTDRHPAGDRGYRPRPRFGALAHGRSGRASSLRCLRPGPDRQHLQPDRYLLRNSGAAAEIPVRSQQPGVALPARQQREDGAAQRRGQDAHRDRTAHREPSGPVPGGDDLLQPASRASRWATPWTAVRAVARESLPRHRPHLVPGHGRRRSSRSSAAAWGCCW